MGDRDVARKISARTWIFEENKTKYLKIEENKEV
jgi:hypothetical protein